MIYRLALNQSSVISHQFSVIYRELITGNRQRQSEIV